jgi:hypothetical protein
VKIGAAGIGLEKAQLRAVGGVGFQRAPLVVFELERLLEFFQTALVRKDAQKQIAGGGRDVRVGMRPQRLGRTDGRVRVLAVERAQRVAEFRIQQRQGGRDELGGRVLSLRVAV